MSGLPRPLRVFVAAAAAALVAAAAAHCGRGNAAGPSANPEVAKAIERSRAANPGAWRRKVILLGFDGCDPDLVEEMIRQGKLPNFARMRREGAWGALESITPTLSPVVWTTIATGMPPERHGILDFVTDTPQVKGVPVSSKMRQADTMWEILSRHGEEVGVVGWLVSYPAEPVNGFLVTERMGLLAYEYGKEQDTEAPQRTHPEELAAEIEAKDRVTIDDLPLAKVRPFADVTEREFADSYSTRFHPLNRLGNLRLNLATAETFRGVGARLLAERRPRFFACYFEAMDAISHVFMPFAPPKMPTIPEKEYLKFRSAMEANYRWHDTVLGEFLDAADEDTTLLLVSDHGFKWGDFRRQDSSDFHEKTGAMWHRPYGVFFAWGNGVARAKRVDGATVYDVAPTVLAAMGYPKPADMKGRVLTEAFAADLAVEQVSTYFGTELRERRIEETAGRSSDLTPEEEELRQKFFTLGYISGDRSDPATTQLNLGLVHLTNGRVELALEVFEKVLKEQRTPRSLACAADALIRLGRLEEADKLIAEAESIDPTDFHAKQLRLRLHIRNANLDLAEALCRDLVARFGDFPQSHSSQGDVLLLRAEAAEKAKDAKKAEAARIQAALAYERAYRLEPRQPTICSAIARILLELPPDPERLAKALELLDEALRIRPDEPLYLNHRGIAKLRLGLTAAAAGRADEARTHLEAALADTTKAVEVWRARSGREYARAWANRAYVLWKLGRLDEADESRRKCLEAKPEYEFNAEFLSALKAAGR